MVFKIESLLLLLCLFIPVTLWASPEKITFSYNVDPNPPYVMGGGQKLDWKKPGITLEVLKLMGSLLNVEIEFIPVPDKRSFVMVCRGHVDGSFHWSFSPERAKSVHYPMADGQIESGKRLMSQAYFLYKLKNTPLRWDGTRFYNVNGRVGANLGSSIVKKLQASGLDVHHGILTGQLIQMLMIGRLEGVVTIGSLGDCAVKTYAHETIEIIKVSPPVKEKNYYLVLSKRFVKKYPGFPEKIWNGIREIRRSGKYKEIAGRYAE